MEKIKILFLINKFKRGGAERAFANQINELNRRGYDIYLGIIYDFSADNSYFNDLNISADKIINFSFSKVFDLKKLLLLKNLVVKEDVEIVYSTLETANILARFLKIIAFGEKFKVVIRESGMAYRKNYKNKIFDFILNFFTDKIIAVSEEVKKSLIGYQKIHKNKIVVIENGVPVRPWDEIRVKRNEINEEEENLFTIMNVGSMANENKGQWEILNIFKEAEDKIKNIRLILVGDGVLKEKYSNFAKKNNLGDKILFTGYIKTDELINYYLKADLFILYSKSEGCPNVVLEAMAYGLPVISTQVGGVSKIIEDGKSGFLIKKGDKNEVNKIIADLVKNKELREKISYNAYHRIRDKYSIQGKADELMEIFTGN